MSDKFNGFSQDEINKVSGEKKPSSTTIAPKAPLKQAFRGQHTGIRRVPEKWSKVTTQQLFPGRKLSNNQKPSPSISSASLKENEMKGELIAGSMANNKNQMNEINRTPQKQEDNSVDMLDDINLDASLSKSLENVLFYHQRKVVPENDANDTKASNSSSNTTDSGNESSILKIPNADFNATSSDDSSILPNPNLKILSDANTNNISPYPLNTDSPFKGVSLKDFETHRKMIQEQNKQKKDLLYKAIELHSKKTAAEARKIEEIKSELAKLDSDLAVDVAILRKQIDAACVHFSTIEKQYMKIEAQFLKAKLDLHNAAERKELLTEHLCTVIAHNEDRKAQKLSELMEKVGLTATEEPFEGVQN